MGNEIPEQLAMFLRSVALGGVLGLVYDLARCLRRLGGPLWRGLLDVAVSLTAAASLFFFIMAGSGELRLFILIGALGGGVLFFSLLSPLLRPLWDFWLDLLLIPARLLGRIGKKLYRICKKLFSFPRKWFTIIVTHWRERLRPARGGGEEMAAAKKSGKKAKKRSGGKLPLLIFLALRLAFSCTTCRGSWRRPGRRRRFTPSAWRSCGRPTSVWPQISPTATTRSSSRRLPGMNWAWWSRGRRSSALIIDLDSVS